MGGWWQSQTSLISSWVTDYDEELSDSRQGFRLATGGNKQRPCGPGTAGIWVGIPWLGIAVVQKYQIQLPFMSRQLEKQGRAHLSCCYLKVLIATTMHPLPGPQRAPGRVQQLVRIQTKLLRRRRNMLFEMGWKTTTSFVFQGTYIHIFNYIFYDNESRAEKLPYL